MSLVVSSPKHSSLKERNTILKCASENTPEWAIPILRKEKPVLFFAVLGTPAMCATRRIVLVVLIFYVTRHRNAETCIFFFKIIEICCCFTFFLVLSLNSHFQNVLFLTLSSFHITVKKQKTKNQDVLKWFLVQQPTPTFLACCCRCCLLILFF